MEPLAERHREPLRSALADPAVWRWVKIDAAGDPALFDGWFDQALANVAARSEFAFATVRRCGRRRHRQQPLPLLRPDDLGLEIGWTLVSRRPGAAAPTARPSC